MNTFYDVVIIGSGAAGMMCGIEAGKRRKKILIIDHANKVGKKILMSGGGYCNFTNYHISPEKYIGHNAHFVKSALKCYTQWDFIDLIEHYQIAYYEKTLGQLFCKNKAKCINEMMLNELKRYQAQVIINTQVKSIKKVNNFELIIYNKKTAITEIINCDSLVIATGGLSIPTLGATDFGYKVARQFNLAVYKDSAGLVPLILSKKTFDKIQDLSGLSIKATVTCQDGTSFTEGLLFTHKGLSGPVILQSSSYWKREQEISVCLNPDINLQEKLHEDHKIHSKIILKKYLHIFYPKRLVQSFVHPDLLCKQLAQLSKKEILYISAALQNWCITPYSTEGYRTAEVTLGGVSTDEISSKTMQAYKVKNLYFIGEVLDVTGWLGGYNFQWAWSSGWVAGQYV